MSAILLLHASKGVFNILLMMPEKKETVNSIIFKLQHLINRKFFIKGIFQQSQLYVNVYL